MKRTFLSLVATLAIAVCVAACGTGSAGTLGIEALDEVSGIRVVAENAGSDQRATTSGAITLGEGDVLLISHDLTKGALHLTVTSQDGATVAYDDVAEGRVLFTCEAAPGVYDVEVTGEGTTGSMVVCAQSAAELEAQDASLTEALEDTGVEIAE